MKKKTLLLSVGMIVKNEEKKLRRCLECLKPLLQQVPSELIIVDTGSTDKTVEIAKEYTENVFYFEWCNDFSAARNFAMDKARGQWYFSMDADQYLDEDITELVNFFKSNKKDIANTAAIKIYNYTEKEDNTAYYEVFVLQLCKLSTGNRFQGAIHESLSIIKPIEYIATILHHDGYIYESDAEMMQKCNRNLDLLYKELEKDPHSINNLLYAADSTLNLEEKESFLLKAVSLSKAQPTHNFAKRAYFLTVLYYYTEKRYQDSLEKALEYLEVFPNTTLVHIDIYALILYSYLEMKNLEKVLEFCNQYWNALWLLKENKLNTEDFLCHTMFFGTTINMKEIGILEIKCCMETKQYDKAQEALDKALSFPMKDHTFELDKTLIHLLFDLLEEKDSYVILSKYYDTMKIHSIQSREQSDIFPLFQKMLEVYFLNHKEKQKEIGAEFNTIYRTYPEDTLAGILHIASEENEKDFHEKLQTLIENVSDWNTASSILYYYCICYHHPLPQEAFLISAERQIEILSSILCNKANNLFQCLEYAYQLNTQDNIPLLAWKTNLLQTSLQLIASLEEEAQLQLCKEYGSCMASYVMQLYQPHILNDDTIGILPSNHQFGYYYKKALSAKEQGDSVAYIRILHHALKQSPYTKKLVQLLINDFEKEQTHTNEFEVLAKQVMKSIKELLAEGKKQNALELLTKYLAICPNDVGAKKILEELEQSM
ncbi:MAG: glycosyltransferase family 2 protein [Epulopiscium sp.]|jgi:glycosyltransferase involved in cell wall biosynthesis|nr:glycosyltransferase family 2 protein [Candidatus Epulonipiscium sp.]